MALLLAASHLIAEKTYPVDGVVVSLNVADQTLLVSHRPIPKLMGAMAMPFRVANADEMANLRPGDRVEFELVVGKNSSIARHIRKTAGPEIPIPIPANRVAVGAPVPDFVLTDQMPRAQRGA